MSTFTLPLLAIGLPPQWLWQWLWPAFFAIAAIGLTVGWARDRSKWRRLLGAIVCLVMVVATSIYRRPLHWDDWLWFLLWPALGLVVVAASFPISRVEKRRRTELVAWAKQNGFSFLSSERTDAAKTLPGALRDLPFFGRGESPITECVLQRPEPSGRVLLFDYEFSKRAIPDPNWFFQRDRLPVRHTIVAFELSRPTLPAFELRPERFRDRVAAVFGANDFDFETHPEFSSAYHLDGTDPEAVRRVFHAEVLDWLETDPNWIIEGRGRWLLTCRPCDVPFLSLDANRSGRTGSDDGRPRSRRRAGSIHPVCTQRVLEHHRLPTASAKIPAPAGGLRLRLPRSL